MKKTNWLLLIIKVAIAIPAFLFGQWFTSRYVLAQTVVAPITIESTQPHTACTLPPAGTSAYCFASDGLYQSISGAAYALVNAPPPTAGVLSIAVNGGAAQTGAVALTIPTTATTTGTFTTTIH